MGVLQKEVDGLKKLTSILSYILVAAAAAMVTMSLNVRNAAQPVPKLTELANLIEERFIGETDRTAMEDAAAAAMVASLGDRWSYYIPAADFAAHMEQMNNAYVGIGITIQAAEDGTGYLVVKVNEGSSAQEAGMLAGDVIVAAEGRNAGGMTSEELRNLVRGEENTTVQLTVRRDGKDIPLTVTRKQVLTVVAEGKMLEDSIGLVTIVNFDARCADETIAAVEDLLAQGAKKLIFDVRNNPGGYAEEMVKVLDYLLPAGPLFRTVNYLGNEHVSESDADFLDLPMAVLVNANSFSAAEFFAAALREYDAAIVLGEHTSGKGYFQNTLKLSDGSAVGLSVGKYNTPKGVNLEGVGLTPDVVVEVDDETFAAIYAGTLAPELDPQLQAAIAALKDR